MKKEIGNEIIMNIGILLLGICLTLWADKVTNLVSILLGIIAVVYAVYGFIGYFRNKERQIVDNLQLIYAITMLVIGGILIFKVDFLKELVSFIIGIYILLSSIIRLQEVIQVGKDLNTKVTSSIILSLVGIFIGVMCIVGKFLVPDIIITYIGILLIIYSIINVVNLVMIRRK